MKRYLYIGLIIVGLVGFYFFNLNDDTFHQENNLVQEYQSPTTNSKEDMFYAEIRGEVRYPDVYLVPENAIVRTLIDLAGGLNDTADVSRINQAEELKPNSRIDIPAITNDFSNIDNNQRLLFVDIKGEVVNPGVYEVSSGMRIYQLIELAGGLTINANVEKVNQSQLLSDGMSILIPTAEDDSTELISVQIDGEVKNPGYYQLDSDSKISDLINLAGGVLDNANLSDIELNKTLVSGEKIMIPAYQVIEMIYVSIKGEVVEPGTYYVEETITVKDLIFLAGGLTTEANVSSINYNQTLVLGSVINIQSLEDSDYSPIDNDNPSLININTANLDELMSLTGVGEIIGQRIIDYRNENGYFQSIEDIKLVSGIKDSIYEQIKDDITV